MQRREFLRLAAVGSTVMMTGSWGAACGDGNSAGGSAAGLPNAAQMMRWIEEIVAQGIRRPGYPADQWVEQWAAEHFRAFGLQDVRFEDVPLPYWDSPRAELILPTDGTRFTGLACPHCTPGVVEAELAPLARGGVDGRLAVKELTPLNLPLNGVREIATAHYDPSGEFDTLDHPLPFDTTFNGVMDAAIQTGAIGFVGLLTGFSWETRDYYVPYDAVLRPIPGLWLSGGDGRQLLERMNAGPLRARLEVEAERRPIVSHNVLGMLPGSSDEWVIIASHHDAPWASAVEDASGVTLVLAQAAHWASVPPAERPHNLLFLLTAGHMAGGAGTRAFIETHRDMLGAVVLEVHLEHAARRAIGENGALVRTDDPEVRWWFTTRNPRLEATVHAALTAHDLGRSVIFRPNIFFENPPTDGAFFHAEGVPLVHYLTAPMYLFDSGDTVDKIHEGSLEPVSRAAIQIIESTRGVSAADMRAGVVDFEVT